MEKTIQIKDVDYHEARLDKFLVTYLKEEYDFSRVYLQKLIKEGDVLVNNSPQSANYRLTKGDVIVINLPALVVDVIQGEDLPLKVIYEDKDLLIIDKPNNMVVHPSLGNWSGTVVNALMNQVDDLSGIGGVERPGIVHRLDKQTTGLLIVAKNDATHQKLTTMFKHHEIKKEYIALVWGVIDEDEALIDAPIGRSSNDRKKMSVTATNSKPAKTWFKVLNRFAHATEVLVSIESGRTHQIRVHFNYINHPVINDPLYGKLKEKPTPYGQYLHAYKLTFLHPTTGEKMEFISSLPQEFNDKIEELKSEA